jgi:uncharacterized membrane protein
VIDATKLLAIAAMALATAATRLAGPALLKSLTITGRTKAALDALPPAILMAVIAPTVIGTGIAETVAAGITATAAFLRLPLLLVIAIGVASVVALRTFL